MAGLGPLSPSAEDMEHGNNEMADSESRAPSGDVNVTSMEEAPSGAATVTPAGDSGATPVTVTLRGIVTVTPSGMANEETSFSTPTQPTSSQPHQGPQRPQTANNSSSLFGNFITATESGLPRQKWGYFNEQAN